MNRGDFPLKTNNLETNIAAIEEAEPQKQDAHLLVFLIYDRENCG
jgi:hypothetical protein